MTIIKFDFPRGLDNINGNGHDRGVFLPIDTMKEAFGELERFVEKNE